MSPTKIALLALALLASSASFAAKICFVAQEEGAIIHQEGDCNKAYAPESTFKIAISLMGYDSGILIDEDNPEIDPDEGYQHYLNTHRGTHNPRTWMRDSCLWYSQKITPLLGLERFRQYVMDFDYGNRDIMGNGDAYDGLTNSWVMSSMAISPMQQLRFVQKIVNKQLPVSQHAYDMTKKILFREELAGGWMLYGKTGAGYLLNADKTRSSLKHGWFVGWMEKNGHIVTFAAHIEMEEQTQGHASFVIRDKVRSEYLWEIIERIEGQNAQEAR